ncbi:Glucose-methanol-choline (GMC) oxidoreductase:NAD binding site [hydrothermal vent metagenome]|uniref:Cholesterol oxidase n=1 Tax=hydrothermal vent metagenome TaxID=652676 RepID=A0A3B0Z9S5_9ZZZZ
MNKLSSHIEQIKQHYTVIVIGSGYGGGISASRMARAGQSVCLLERGKEFLPGEFPDTLAEAGAELQVDSGEIHLGSESGLYNLQINDDINVLTGCGLGGTSLINASVLIESDPRIFNDPAWPRDFVSDVDTALKDGYQKARAMLGSATYPDGNNGFPVLKKTEAMRQCGKAMGVETRLTPLAVNFEVHENGVNHVGVAQEPCNLCGDCITGCNFTAKNTTQMTYLPDAKNHGAEIFTQTKVSHLSRKDDHWVVHYAVSNNGSDAFDAPDQFVHADIVVLAAGTLGSTEIMLRSKERGLETSDQIGERFSGNGDVLGFVYNCDQEINGIGRGTRELDAANPVGPCITSVIDTRSSSDNYKDGMTIEEGCLSGAMAPLLPSTFSKLAAISGKDSDSGVMDFLAEKRRSIESLLRGAYHGALDNTLTNLVMSHDSTSGRMQLKEDSLCIEWPGIGDEAIFSKVNDRLESMSKTLGGTFVKNPISHDLMGNDQVTVHPLGGCCMGEDASSGVVNHKGQVYSSNSGNAIYEDLYIADGAIIPAAIGTNPLLTISAVAERNAKLMASEREWNFDTELPSRPANDAVIAAVKPGIQFTETMIGFVTLDPNIDYEQGFKQGKHNNTPFEFTLTVVSQDLDAMLADSNHQAAIYGTVKAPMLSPTPLTVTEGVFNLFVKDPEIVDTRRMDYNLTMTAQNGDVFYMEGHKTIHDDPGFDMWKDTTTLFATVTTTKADPSTAIGRGILEITPINFAKQLTTIKVPNVESNTDRLKYIARFGAFFAGEVFDIFGGVATGLNYFTEENQPRKRRPLAAPVPSLHHVVTEDDVSIRLTRYQGGDKGPVILSHGLGVSSKIFSTDTLDTNLLEYLLAHDYDVWLLDYRVSIELTASQTASTADEIAQYDYPAAVAKVIEVTGKESVQMVVHCYGATTWTMSMLGGHLKNIRSAVVSQISTHIKVPLLSKIKTGLYVPELLDQLGVDSLTAYTARESSWQDKLLDKALKLYPIQKEEQCKNPVCRRITFLYGQLYEHDQLNGITHDNLHELYGVVNMRSLEHLATMTREGNITDADGNDRYLPHLERMALPITFIVGEENECFLPESLKKTHQVLSDKNGAALYGFHQIPDYGHIDCIHGKNAHKDVYPHILKQLEETL